MKPATLTWECGHCPDTITVPWHTGQTIRPEGLDVPPPFVWVLDEEGENVLCPCCHAIWDFEVSLETPQPVSIIHYGPFNIYRQAATHVAQ